MNPEAALAYAERHTLHALLIEVDGAVVFEQYANGYDAAKPHALYSGTKSFWGVTAAAAHDDGLLDLDEPGEKFTYGGIPLQVFGAVLTHKLASRKLTPHEYLRARLLDPIGVSIG